MSDVQQCPYCMHPFDEEETLDPASDGIQVVCNKCEKIYHIIPHVTYSTKRFCSDNGNEHEWELFIESYYCKNCDAWRNV